MENLIIFLIGPILPYIIIFIVAEVVTSINDSLDKKRPCAHGIAGAYSNPNLCNKCIQERLDRRKAYEQEQLEKEKAYEEERRRTEREKSQRDTEYRKAIRNESYLKQMDPIEFERITHILFQAQGYSVEKTPVTGDGGIDGLLRKCNELILLQCKRYGVKNSVGEPIVRDLYGNMAHYKTIYPNLQIKGLLVTTGNVS